jgi:hypothetical protein
MSDGLGVSVPPLKDHVVIYFLEKKASQSEAFNFYDHFQKRHWKNNRDTRLANWKNAAWQWILNLSMSR